MDCVNCLLPSALRVSYGESVNVGDAIYKDAVVAAGTTITFLGSSACPSGAECSSGCTFDANRCTATSGSASSSGTSMPLVLGAMAVAVVAIIVLVVVISIRKCKRQVVAAEPFPHALQRPPSPAYTTVINGIYEEVGPADNAYEQPFTAPAGYQQQGYGVVLTPPSPFYEFASPGNPAENV